MEEVCIRYEWLVLRQKKLSRIRHQVIQGPSKTLTNLWGMGDGLLETVGTIAGTREG